MSGYFIILSFCILYFYLTYLIFLFSEFSSSLFYTPIAPISLLPSLCFQGVFKCSNQGQFLVLCLPLSSFSVCFCLLCPIQMCQFCFVFLYFYIGIYKRSLPSFLMRIKRLIWMEIEVVRNWGRVGGRDTTNRM